MTSTDHSIVKLFALTAAVGLVVSALAPAAMGVAAASTGNNQLDGAGNEELSIGVQQGAGNVTVSVSHNGSAVDNASVMVDADGQYDGSGSHVTDSEGILSLPVPNQTVNVTITAEKDGLTGSTNATLRAHEGQGAPFVPMGQRVAAFVHGLEQSDGIVAIGPFVADYVHSLAPPDEPAGIQHTGPPTWLDSVKQNGGPPGFVGQQGPSAANEDGGPPEHAGGPPASVDTENGTDDGGPPNHAGEDEGEEESNSEAADDDENDGPPPHARS